MNTSANQGSATARVIGLIGGMSWESSAEYYKLINQAVRRRLGPLRSARLLMYSVDFGPIEQAQHAGQWDALAGMLEDAAQRLHRGGADCVVLCTNTMHKVADHVAASVPIPFLHIADPVGRTSTQNGTKVLGLLATRFTMEQRFYVDVLEAAGLKVLVPDIGMTNLNGIIYEELVKNIVRDESRRTYVDAITRLQARGAEAVILGCTEIGLLIDDSVSPIPTYDTTALHAAALAQAALE